MMVEAVRACVLACQDRHSRDEAAENKHTPSLCTTTLQALVVCLKCVSDMLPAPLAHMFVETDMMLYDHLYDCTIHTLYTSLFTQCSTSHCARQ